MKLLEVYYESQMGNTINCKEAQLTGQMWEMSLP